MRGAGEEEDGPPRHRLVAIGSAPSWARLARGVDRGGGVSSLLRATSRAPRRVGSEALQNLGDGSLDPGLLLVRLSSQPGGQHLDREDHPAAYADMGISEKCARRWHSLIPTVQLPSSGRAPHRAASRPPPPGQRALSSDVRCASQTLAMRRDRPSQ